MYDKEKMEAYHKELDSVPAHLVKEKTMYITYRHDNAFDQAAFSQLTAGDKPGKIKIFTLEIKIDELLNEKMTFKKLKRFGCL